MRSIRWTLLAATLVAASAVVVGANPASAEDSSPASAQAVTYEQYLRDNPDAPRRANGAIPIAPGVDLLPPSQPPSPSSGVGVLHDGHSVGSGRGACPYYHICIWDSIEFGGSGIGFYTCGDAHLSNWGWADRASSLVNNQTPGTVSWLWDWGSNSWFGSQTAYGYRRNMNLDYDSSGTSWNNRLDVIRVC